MKIGAIFPQNEIGSDPAVIREYAQAVESMGYAHILAYDHVLGADPANRPGWQGYTHENMFHEPFVLFGYFAAITERVELVTDVIILPQRQTALVAKQAAQVDVLSSGRMRLGVGVGWNAVEYEALGMDFTTRGKQIEEQVELMRRLWTEPILSYEGRWHRVTEAGLNPLPVQRPIPVWMGGTADVLLRRVARMADGWFPQMAPESAHDSLERLRRYTEEAGRPQEAVGIEARVNIGDTSPDEWARQTEEWDKLGATHIGLNTMNAGLKGLDEHLEALRKYIELVGSVLD